MNPSDNNPLTPSGMGGSTIPSPVDFTNPNATATGVGGLSMSDSLASAQDSLTSAGQAANSLQSDTMGLNQIGANDPSASMIRPDQPLTPAAPVPGSIGSVTSVPPLSSDTSSVDSNANSFGSTSSPSSFGGGTSGSFGSTGASMGTTSTSTMPVTTSTMPTFGGGATSSEPAKQPYNPFARATSASSTPTSATMPPSTGPTSSATVPTSLRPQTEKFSDRLSATGAGKPHSNVAAIIGWGMAVICAVAAVIFAILWIGELNKEPEIKYIQVEAPAPQETTALMNCTADFGDAPVEGLDGLLGHASTINANFTDSMLRTITMSDAYTFADGDVAVVAQGVFDERQDAYMQLMAELGSDAIAAGTELVDNVLVYTITAANAQLTADSAYLYGLPVAEDGTVEKSLDGVKAVYEGAGYVCEIE